MALCINMNVLMSSSLAALFIDEGCVPRALSLVGRQYRDCDSIMRVRGQLGKQDHPLLSSLFIKACRESWPRWFSCMRSYSGEWSNICLAPSCGDHDELGRRILPFSCGMYDLKRVGRWWVEWGPFSLLVMDDESVDDLEMAARVQISQNRTVWV